MIDIMVGIALFISSINYPLRAEVVDTLPSGQCVSLFLEFISTTYQCKYIYYNEDTTNRVVCITEGCPLAGICKMLSDPTILTGGNL